MLWRGLVAAALIAAAAARERACGTGQLVFAADRRYVLASDPFRSVRMGKGQEKPNKGNKPKLSVKDKKQKKKDKAASKGG
jgi:hypothetical protein